MSSDPSQLAAMIKALSNKTRKKTFQEDGEQQNISIVSRLISNDLEKSNGSSAFDMEKYLRKTEVSRCEGGLGNFSRTGMSDIWDLSLPKERTTQDIHIVDLDATSISIRESEENTPAVYYGENRESENQESFRTTDSSNSVITTIRKSESAIVDVKTYSIDDKSLDTGNSEKATSISIPTSNYSLVKSPFWLSEEREEKKTNGGNQRQNEYVSETSSSEKHVTFGTHFLISPKNVGKYQSNWSHFTKLYRVICFLFSLETIPFW